MYQHMMETEFVRRAEEELRDQIKRSAYEIVMWMGKSNCEQESFVELYSDKSVTSL